MKLDGVWRIIEADIRHHKLRVFEADRTWVHSRSEFDDPILDYRVDGSTLLLGRVGIDADGGELHAPLVACGRIDAREDSMEITWSRGNYSDCWGHEVLIRDKPGAEKTPSLPRACEIPGVGVLTLRFGSWRGRVVVDGSRHVDIDVPTDEAMLAHAAAAVARLRSGGYAQILAYVADKLLYDHKDWERENAAKTAAELATRIRHDTIAIDKNGVVRLWFGGRDVFTDHSFIAVLKPDGTVKQIERN